MEPNSLEGVSVFRATIIQQCSGIADTPTAPPCFATVLLSEHHMPHAIAATADKVGQGQLQPKYFGSRDHEKVGRIQLYITVGQ